MAVPLEDRYQVNPATGCWIYLGSRDTDGYGRVGTRVAHRVYYEHFVGPIPTGLELDHLCVRPACVNPAHLEPVTGAENLRRATLYRYARFSSSGRSGGSTCFRGHEYTEENTRTTKSGRRVCRECRREYDRTPEARTRKRDYKRERRALGLPA